MKTRFRGLALTAIFLSGTSMTFAQQGASVGDLPGSSVGDLPGFGEEAYFHEQATYAAASYVGDAPPPGYAPGQPSPFNPNGVSALEPALFGAGSELRTVSALAGSACDAAGLGVGIGAGIDDCNGDCSDPCDTCNDGFGFGLGKKLGLGKCDLGLGKKLGLGKGDKLFRVFDKFDNCTWAQAEFLTWWLPDRDMTALVTTSAPGTAPVLPEGGADNVAIVWGDPIEGEITGGFRGDIGRFVITRSQCQH
jgi:hypothetical protein